MFIKGDYYSIERMTKRHSCLQQVVWVLISSCIRASLRGTRNMVMVGGKQDDAKVGNLGRCEKNFGALRDKHLVISTHTRVTLL